MHESNLADVKAEVCPLPADYVSVVAASKLIFSLLHAHAQLSSKGAKWKCHRNESRGWEKQQMVAICLPGRTTEGASEKETGLSVLQQHGGH